MRPPTPPRSEFVRPRMLSRRPIVLSFQRTIFGKSALSSTGLPGRPPADRY
jgi:hypothetical protein